MESQEEKTAAIKEVKTTGKHLNNLYLYAVYFVSFAILAVFLMLSFFGFRDTMKLADIWPFIFYVVIVIFFSILIIDRARIKSKRTAQRDMRKL